jgi:hypothetical protein
MLLKPQAQLTSISGGQCPSSTLSTLAGMNVVLELKLGCSALEVSTFQCLPLTFLLPHSEPGGHVWRTTEPMPGKHRGSHGRCHKQRPAGQGSGPLTFFFVLEDGCFKLATHLRPSSYESWASGRQSFAGPWHHINPPQPHPSPSYLS